MHHQFNIQQLYALPTLFCVFCIYLRTNSDLCHLQHKLIGFYNRDEKCLLRGTNWVFKYSGLRFVIKGLKCNANIHSKNLPSSLCIYVYVCVCVYIYIYIYTHTHTHLVHTAHLLQQCHNSKCVIFQERLLKFLKCYNFL